MSATNSFVVIVLVPPYSATLAATAVTGTNAQMNGMATPNGTPAFAWFEWGVSSSYGNRTTPVPVGSGKSVAYVTNLLSGLALAQPYHFRLVTSNTVAVTYGFDQIFDVGGIIAWGDNGAGQTNVPPVLTNTAVAVAGGFNDSLALRNNARPIAWGDNSFNQTNVPASVTNAVAVSSGGNFNLALRNTGRVVAWGYNVDGETNVPASASNVVAIAGGGFHSLALRANGTVVAWGWNVAHETNVPVNLSNIVAVAGGSFHSLALKNDGTVVAWGDNSDGETNVPAGLNTVVAIAAGANLFSLALKTNGTVVAWGNDYERETDVPAGLSNVVAIAAGSQHCLALKSDGTVVAWGDDTFGQTDVPAGLVNVAAVAAGGSHSLALVSSTPVNLLPNTAPFFLATPADQAINVLTTITVTNTAVDLDVPTNTLVYTLSSTLGGPNAATINTNTGVITWTPTLGQAGLTNLITTIVTDNGAPPLSATNSFAVIVYPIPGISSITATNLGGFDGYLLQWYAPTNDRFQVQWTPNLGFTGCLADLHQHHYLHRAVDAHERSVHLLRRRFADRRTGPAAFLPVDSAGIGGRRADQHAARAAVAGDPHRQSAESARRDEHRDRFRCSRANVDLRLVQHPGRRQRRHDQLRHRRHHLDADARAGRPDQPHHDDRHRQRRAAVERNQFIFRGRESDPVHRQHHGCDQRPETGLVRADQSTVQRPVDDQHCSAGDLDLVPRHHHLDQRHVHLHGHQRAAVHEILRADPAAVAAKIFFPLRSIGWRGEGQGEVRVLLKFSAQQLRLCIPRRMA